VSAPPLVEMRGADVAHEDDRTAVLLRDVDWTIRDGEWWAVQGRPGSGKSALLMTAAGLNPPVRGRLRVFGEDLAAAGEATQLGWRRALGFVWEGGGRLLGRLTVAENVGLALRYHEDLEPGEARERVVGLLALAGLEARADDPPSRLGPAMRQRVALLRALAQPITLLFLDDPLRGLAPGDVDWWRRFLRRLREARAEEGRPLTLVVSGYEHAAFAGDADRFGRVADGRFATLAAADPAAAPAAGGPA